MNFLPVPKRSAGKRSKRVMATNDKANRISGKELDMSDTTVFVVV